MEREYEYLLSLLGDYLTGAVPQPDPEVSWEKLVQLSQIHCVTGILGHMTMQHTLCPKPEIQTELRQVCLQTIALYAQRAAAMDALSARLTGIGIPHIVMKGYVLRRCYPIPELRTFGDIDFVIHPEDRNKCHDLMMADGYHLETDWEPVFSYTRGSEYYEIHTDIMEVDVSEKADYRGYFQQLWQRTIPDQGLRYQFTPEFHFLYLLTHIAKHIQGAGAGARMYLDIAVFLKYYGNSLDWDYVNQELHTLKLYDFAGVVFTAVEQWFHIPSPIEHPSISDEVLEEFKIFTMEAGVFGHFQRESGVNALKRAGDDAAASRTKLLLTRAFPPAEQIKSRYTYLQKRPWLLPAAWIHRLIKNRGSLASQAHDAQVILTADTREVQRLQDLTRNIGL